MGMLGSTTHPLVAQLWSEVIDQHVDLDAGTLRGGLQECPTMLERSNLSRLALVRGLIRAWLERASNVATSGGGVDPPQAHGQPAGYSSSRQAALQGGLDRPAAAPSQGGGVWGVWAVILGYSSENAVDLSMLTRLQQAAKGMRTVSALQSEMQDVLRGLGHPSELEVVAPQGAYLSAATKTDAQANTHSGNLDGLVCAVTGCVCRV